MWGLLTAQSTELLALAQVLLVQLMALDTPTHEQFALFDSHHRVHGMKLLSMFLPNGLTGSIYGPTSARHPDSSLLDWSGFENHMLDACARHFGNNVIYAVYGDSIFFGPCFCVRSRHVPIPSLNLNLTVPMELMNSAMNSSREGIELGYGYGKKQFPLLEVKDFIKLKVVSDLCQAQVGVMHFLANCLTCMREGNTVTGQRMFAMDPPSIEDYLHGNVC